jgi:hypothetical protein
MAFSAVPTTSALAVGDYLKIVSRDSVYNNLSEDSPLWDYIKKLKANPEEGRELRFLLRSAYGSHAAQFVTVDGGAYPAATRATISEGTAQFKDYALTIEMERTLIQKAVSDFSRYGEPLAEEMRSKTIAMSRILSGSAYRDGTGVLGTQSSTAVDFSPTNDGIVSLDTSDTARGFVGWFELGDRVNFFSPDGASERTPTVTGTHDHFIVIDRDRANDKVTLRSVTAAGATNDWTAAGDIASGDLIYRDGQPSKPDLAAIALTDDLNTASEEWAGLAAFARNDGQVVNGIALSGALGNTTKDAGGNPIDSQVFQQLMSQVMVGVGAGRYNYNMAMMAWETLDALVESREVDRRFQSVQDNQRGVSSLGYIAGKHTLVFEADEFCPKNRIYCLPEGKKGVLQFHGSDFEFVQPEGGQKFFLRPNGSGHDRTIRAYMEGSGTLLCTHAKAIGLIRNFTV